MGFDLKAFEKAEYESRIEEVEVPELKDFFGKDEEPVWKVRNLSAPELAKVDNSASSNEKLTGIIKGIFSADPKKMGAALKELVLPPELEPEYIKALTRVELGSVDPEKPDRQEILLKMGKVSPNAFYRISNKIHALSGQGSILGKPKASTESKKSKTS